MVKNLHALEWDFEKKTCIYIPLEEEITLFCVATWVLRLLISLYNVFSSWVRCEIWSWNVWGSLLIKRRSVLSNDKSDFVPKNKRNKIDLRCAFPMLVLVLIRVRVRKKSYQWFLVLLPRSIIVYVYMLYNWTRIRHDEYVIHILDKYCQISDRQVAAFSWLLFKR